MGTDPDPKVEFIGGPEKRAIVIEPYDSSWVDKFEEHRRRISEALGPRARRVDHIGSTSVAGLAAKPIVDIQVSVIDIEDESLYVDDLVEAGYQHRVREAGHRMFRTPALDVHVHVCEHGSSWERRHLLLRDWLRQSSEDRHEYAELKRALASEEWETMDHYADAKGGLIAEISLRAEEWARLTGWNP